MRLTPNPPKIPEIGGFTSENDIFGYRGFAERLTSLVKNINEPLVLTLDGPWGCGKSVFVRQWAGLLREHGAPVIEFDAFGSDHYDDAFLPLSAEIHATAKDVLGARKATTKRYLDRAQKAGVILTPFALRVAARASTAGLLALDDIEAGRSAIKDAAQTLGDETTKALEAAVSKKLKEASEERATLESFRETFSEIAQSMSEQKATNKNTLPLIFIVDELDRCRPPFALSLIERIKHLFSVPGVCFVLVTHLHQLEQAVQGAYGQRFDARSYLEKFYQLRISLPDRERGSHSPRQKYIDYMWSALDIQFAKPRYGELVKQEISVLTEQHNISLRQIERILSHVSLVSAAAAENQLVVPPIVAGLCVMRQINRELYQGVLTKNFDQNELFKFIGEDKDSNGKRDWSIKWWKYAGNAVLTQDKIDEMDRAFFHYDLDDRTDLIPWMATYIEDLLQADEHLK